MTTPRTPKTGDFYAFRDSGNVVKLGAAVEDGFNARYTDGPSKGLQVVLSSAFLGAYGVVVCDGDKMGVVQ